jgi:murein L,D-transpeptidase YafK
MKTRPGSPYDSLRCHVALLWLALAGPVASAELPAWIIETPDSLATLLVADTGSATLFEYEIDSNDEATVVEHYMSIGEHGVGKARGGDRRTPLGNYIIVDQLDTSRLDPKYGVTAFPIDYPNALDRLEGRTGDGIWLHGVLPGEGRRPERDTDGCIALPNENLADLAGRLEPGVTPLIVTRGMRFSTAEEKQATRMRLNAHLEAWRRSQVRRDAITYLALYSPGFTYRSLDRDDWAAFRAAQLSEPVNVDISIKDVLILEDPEDADLVMTRFNAEVTKDAVPARWTKRLYWRRTADGEYRIVAEDNG